MRIGFFGGICSKIDSLKIKSHRRTAQVRSDHETNDREHRRAHIAGSVEIEPMNEIETTQMKSESALLKESPELDNVGDELRFRLDGIVRTTPLALAVYALPIAFFCYLFTGKVSLLTAVPWLCAVAVGFFMRALPWIKLKSSAPLPEVFNQRALRFVTAGSVLIGATTAAVPALTWNLVSHSERLMFCGILMALLVGGALSLVMLNGASRLWILSVGGIVFLVSFFDNVYLPQGASLLVAGFLLYLYIVVERNSDYFSALFHARVEAARQTQMVSLLLHDFEEEARDWLWEIDTLGRIVYSSARMAESLLRAPESLRGIMLSSALRSDGKHESANSPMLAALRQRFERGHPFRNHTVEYARADQERWFSLSAKPLINVSGQITGWRGTGVDVTNEFMRQKEMERLATIDSLTGLANRFRLQQELDRHFNSLEPAKPCALMMLDLDDFKLINDHFGHPTGDRVLQFVAARLSQQLRSGQVLARLGGDEFALLISGDVPRSSLAEMGERILATVAQPYFVEGASMMVRCSVGIAIGGADAHDAKSLLKCADLALYAAKGAGRNALRFFGYDMHKRIEDRFVLAEEIRHGIDRGEFELMYQPFVDTISGKITGFEALIRWNHPIRGLLLPSEFIPLAEDTALIGRLGEWVFATACRAARSWPENIRISVNVSAVQFSLLDLREAVARTLSESGLPAAQLEVELTESTLFADGPTSRRTMVALRESGVNISLDDFGAGYASLSHLRTFPISRLKIDRSFTAKIADTTREGNEARSIVRAAIELARAMELECTAEGVETADQLAVLKNLYCDEVQGYFLAYPMSAADAGKILLRDGRSAAFEIAA